MRVAIGLTAAQSCERRFLRAIGLSWGWVVRFKPRTRIWTAEHIRTIHIVAVALRLAEKIDRPSLMVCFVSVDNLARAHWVTDKETRAMSGNYLHESP